MLLRSLDQIAHGELALAGLPAAVSVQAVGSEAGPRAVRTTGTTTPQVKSVARQATTCHVGSQRPSGRRTGPGTELLAPTAWMPLPPPPPAGGRGAGAGAPRLVCLVQALGGLADDALASAPADFLFHSAFHDPGAPSRAGCSHGLTWATIPDIPRILVKGHRNSHSAKRRTVCTTVNTQFKRLDRAPRSPKAIRLS